MWGEICIGGIYLVSWSLGTDKIVFTKVVISQKGLVHSESKSILIKPTCHAHLNGLGPDCHKDCTQMPSNKMSQLVDECTALHVFVYC